LDLSDDFDSSNYLSPHSDIVALMVLEHQTQLHNAMTRADFFVRQLIHDASGSQQDLAADPEWQAQLRLLAKDVVDRMLFCGETPLTGEIKGSTPFAEEFAAFGPKDSQGRSLRELDLKTRLFKFPLSYLIYSSAFDALQEPLRQEIRRQIDQVLRGETQSPEYAHLGEPVRREILAILEETDAAVTPEG
jgi:hypothetical protein